MIDKADIRLTHGELYSFVLLTFVCIAAVVVVAMTVAPALRTHAATIPGMAIAVFVVSLIVLPMQRVLVRTYYGREMPLLRSIVSSFIATALVFGGWWLLST